MKKRNFAGIALATIATVGVFAPTATAAPGDVSIRAGSFCKITGATSVATDGGQDVTLKTRGFKNTCTDKVKRNATLAYITSDRDLNTGAMSSDTVPLTTPAHIDSPLSTPTATSWVITDSRGKKTVVYGVGKDGKWVVGTNVKRYLTELKKFAPVSDWYWYLPVSESEIEAFLVEQDAELRK